MKCEVVLAAAFDVIHGLVCGFEQSVWSARVSRKERDAERCACVHHMTVDVVWRAQLFHQLSCYSGNIAPVWCLGQDCDEFVTADSVGLSLLPHDKFHASGRAYKQSVSGLVAECVIDFLESVEVDEQYRHL